MALNFDQPNNLLGTLEIGPNEIVFGQDFRYFYGVPPGEYQVFDMDKSLKLVAPGYGDLSKGGQYGNGAIWVSKAELHKLPGLVAC